MAADINARTVISALWELHGRTDRWPTAEAVAKYLRVPLADVTPLLRELKRKRLFTDRQRNRERVWLPWNEAN